jgi:(2Fe-2S) ferredoxin
MLIALMIILSAQLYGQPEFKTYRNGLIYSRNTMNKLERIVESLNLKYKVCDFNKVFNSKLQTIEEEIGNEHEGNDNEI